MSNQNSEIDYLEEKKHDEVIYPPQVDEDSKTEVMVFSYEEIINVLHSLAVKGMKLVEPSGNSLKVTQGFSDFEGYLSLRKIEEKNIYVLSKHEDKDWKPTQIKEEDFVQLKFQAAKK